MYYFSGTGNSKWAAERIAEKTGEKTSDIALLMRGEEKKIIIASGEKFIIVYPVYAWNSPKLIFDFLRNVTLEEGATSCVVCTCGSEAGHTVSVLKKRIRLDGGYSVVMPDNYVIAFDVESREECLKKVAAARERLDMIADDINSGNLKFDVGVGKFAVLKTFIFSPLFSKYASGTKQFKTTWDCNGCGLCEKICPKGNIKIVDEMPFWFDDCMQCLACINRCPKRAINYGRSTEKRGRYFFDFTEKEIDEAAKIEKEKEEQK
ncbi:MAG: EFR1 family ferrodoxin [Clostridiales bacterium]|nr:EFR1 family ferrodoxin [Clostridiales bacterium]